MISFGSALALKNLEISDNMAERGNTLDKYVVKLYTRAYRDLDNIYTYISETLLEPGTALDIVNKLEEAIFSLEQLLERGAIRRVGTYKDGIYRQLFV